MQHVWISVSSALFTDWPHGYNPGQSVFAELGYSFSPAASCLLPGLISVSGCFSLSFQFHLFLPWLAKTIGLGTVASLSLSVAKLLLRAIPLLSTNNKISGVWFPPIHLTHTTTDWFTPVHRNHREKCPFSTAAHRELGFQIFPVLVSTSFSHAIKYF